MGPTWVLSAPGGTHVGPMNLAIRVVQQPTMLNHAQFLWNAAVMKYKNHGPVDVLVAYKYLQHWKMSLVVGCVNVWVVLNELKSCRWNPVIFSRFQNVNNGAVVTSLIMSDTSHCDIMLTDCSKDAFKITMLLLNRTIQHCGSTLLGLSESIASYLW